MVKNRKRRDERRASSKFNHNRFLLFFCELFLLSFLLHRNFGLLSFGEEAEEDEVQTVKFVQKNTTKSKSVHDVIDDPKLSKEPIAIEKKREEVGRIEERAVESDDNVDAKQKKTDRIRDKLKGTSKSDKKELKRKSSPEKKETKDDSSSDDDYGNALEKERRLKRQKKV